MSLCTGQVAGCKLCHCVPGRWRAERLEIEAGHDAAVRHELLPLLRLADHPALLRGGQLGGHEEAP